MVIKVYGTLSSPPVRSVLLTLKALDLPYELVTISILDGEHKSEYFLKLNPQHTIPTLVDDDGFVVYDSHAIMAYLVNKYAKNDKLYPKEAKRRSMVDRRMFYEEGVLSTGISKYITSILIFEKTETSITPKMIEKCEDGYTTLEKFLSENQYIAGNEITIADFCTSVSLTYLNMYVLIDAERFPLLAAYLERCKTTIKGFTEIVQEGQKLAEQFIRKLLSNS